MQLLMRTAMAIGLVVLAVIALGIYRFNFTKDDLYLRENDNVRPLALVESGAAEVMKRLFSLDTNEPFRIRLPDSDRAVTLTGFNEPHKLAVGEYRHDPVRGEVLLDYRRITPVNVPGRAESMLFVAPFAVTTQGSGVFWYLGMFSIEHQSGRTRHLASQYLGDRVDIGAINVKTPFDPPYSVTVSLKTRTAAQSMTETPAQRVQRTFLLDRGSLQPLPQK